MIVLLEIGKQKFGDACQSRLPSLAGPPDVIRPGRFDYSTIAISVASVVPSVNMIITVLPASMPSTATPWAMV